MLDKTRTLDRKPLMVLEAPQPSSSDVGCGSYWLVAQTHPQAERWAAAQLTSSGYHVYLPLILVQRRDPVLSTLLHRVERPLFSGYLFIQLGDTEQWTPIRHYRGIRQVLMSGERPHRLPEAILSAVQAGEAFRRLPTPDSVLYRPGAPVRCLHHAFQGIDAVIVAVASTTARIALPMFGSIREVTVPIQSLAPLD